MEIIAIIIVAAVVITVITVLILKGMKGQLKLTFENKEYQPGEKISGELYLKAKKEIEGQKLIVTFACDETSSTDYDDHSTSTKTRRLFEEKKTIEEAQNYPAGTEKKYNFEFQIPEEDKPNTTAGKILKTAAKIFSGHKKITRKIEARLYAKGLDLTANKNFKIKK